MDATLAQVATTTLTVLSPFLSGLVGSYTKDFTDGVAKGIGSEVAKPLMAAPRKLYELVKSKLSATETGKEAITDLEKYPEDESTKTVVAVQLRKALESDATFATELQTLLNEFASAIAGGGVNVVNNAPVGQQANIGQVHGGFTMNAGDKGPAASSDTTKSS